MVYAFLPLLAIIHLSSFSFRLIAMTKPKKEVVKEFDWKQLLRVTNVEGEVGYVVTGPDDLANTFYFFFDGFTQANKVFNALTGQT